MFGAVGEAGDVGAARVPDHEDVVLAIAAGAGLALGDGDHRLHTDNHAGFQHRVAILAQLQPGFAAIVVRQHAKAVAIAEAAVLQQVFGGIDLVQLGGNVGTSCPRHQQRLAAIVDLTVQFPQPQMRVAGLFGKKRAFQRDVIARDHGKAVQRQDVSGADAAACDGVMRAVGVDAGLEPGPCIHQFTLGPGFRDLAHHGRGRVQRNLMFRHADGHGLDAGAAAQIGDAGHFGDMGDLFGGFDHAQPHGGRGDINEFDGGKFRLQQGKRVEGDVVEFDADAPCAADHLADGVEVVVLLPVGIGQVAATKGPPPGLAAVDAGADRGGVLVVNEKAVAPAELAEHEIGVIVDVVIAGEQRCIDAVLRHMRPDRIQPALHLGIREGALGLLAIADIGLQSFACAHRGLPGVRFPRKCRGWLPPSKEQL